MEGGEVEVLGLQVARLNPCLNRHRYRMIYSLEPFHVKNKLVYTFENIGVDLKWQRRVTKQKQI